MKKKKTTVYLVIYSHRFGDDYNVFTTKKKAEKAIEELKASDMYEPDREEFISMEKLELR